MRHGTLILAAHGAHDGSAANDRVRALAEAIAQRELFAAVKVAFNLGTPGFADVFEQVSTDVATVVPVMTSDGYFRRRVLPKALQAAGGHLPPELRLTPPVGTHPRVAALLAQLVRETAAARNVDLTSTAIAVIGHGTRKDARSGAATDTLRDTLQNEFETSAVVSAFLDQDPEVSAVPALTDRATIVITPFFIGGGSHALEDIPEALGVAPEAVRDRPAEATVADRRLVFTPALGDMDALVDLIVDRAQADEYEQLAPTSGDPHPATASRQ